MAIARQRLSLEEHIFQTSAPAVAPLISRKAIEHGLSCRLLQVHVEAGVDPHTAFVYLLGAIFVLQIAAGSLNKIWCGQIGTRSDVQAEGRSASSFGFTCRDLSIL